MQNPSFYYSKFPLKLLQKAMKTVSGPKKKKKTPKNITRKCIRNVHRLFKISQKNYMDKLDRANIQCWGPG